MIDKIIGIKKSNDLTQNALYCIKWREISYIHCNYLKKEQIILIPEGKAALENFQSKENRDFKLISASFPIQDLMIADNIPILADYFKVDRVISKRIYHYNQGDAHNQFQNLEDFTNISPFLYDIKINCQND